LSVLVLALCVSGVALACSEGGENGTTEDVRAWGVPVRIDLGLPDHWVQEGVELAVNADGAAVATWLDSQTGIWTNRYVPGSGWAEPEPIERGEGYPDWSTPPRVAISRDGTAMLVWLESQPDAIRSSRWTQAEGWGATEQVDRGFQEYGVSGPDVAMDDDGNAMATWRRSGDEPMVVASRRIAATGWGTPIQIDDGNTGYDYGTRIAVSPAGSAIAVWRGDDGQGHRLFANRYDVDAGWGNSEAIGDSSNSWIEDDPQVAVDGLGNGIVVWRQDYYVGDMAYYSRVTANRFTREGGWEGPAPIEGEGQSSSYNPDIAMNADGTAAVVWAGSERGDQPAGVWSMRHTPDGGWSAEELVDGYPEYQMSDFSPQVAVDAAGNALVVWRAYNRWTRVGAWASEYSIGEGWDAPVQIDWALWSVNPPRIGVDDEGNGVVIWSESSASGSGVFANHYEPGLGEDQRAFWQPLCDASCERAAECMLLDGQTASACATECVDDLDRMPCEPNEAGADACVAELDALSCEDFDNDYLPYVCDNVCFGDRLCEGRVCDDQNECSTDSCNLADGSCVYSMLPDGTPCAGGMGTCQRGSCASEFPCTERGIRDAIALGGGPHTFDCEGSQVVTTSSEIIIDNQVILDGEGRLTVSGNDTHRVFWNQFASQDIDLNFIGSELRRFTIVRGHHDKGGGIYNSGRLVLADSVVSENTTSGFEPFESGGGGIYNERHGHLTIIRTLISDNVAGEGPEGIGGGIYNLGALTLTDSGIIGNSATFSGSGIYSERYREDPELPFEPVTLTNCTVAGNTVEYGFELGGAVSTTGPMTLTNSTVTANAGGAAIGAGFMSYGDSVLTVVNSTISANAGTGISGQFELVSTTVSGNTIEGRGTALNSLLVTTCTDAQIESLGGNLESPGNTCGLDGTGDQVNVPEEEVALGTLQNNGGSTDTQVPAGTAPIDRIPVENCVGPDGELLPTDQRGVERPQGSRCDVGAVEVSP
jgi:hypothetical protein